MARAAHTSLRIDPQGISLPSPGASQAYIVTAADRTGLETDVTAACAVRSSDPAVVEIDRERGRIFAKAPGRARILVSFEGARAGSQVTVGNRPAELQVRFSPDVVSVLTIKGCNGSGCHGSPAGQSGFKLSLFGYNVEADHEMIVKQQGGRRIDVARPGESLLLKKPAFQIPHGGGRVLPPDSEEYETLLSWLKQGARLDSGGVRLNRLEMYPGERILTAGARQRLVVIGRLSDGTTRDMSRSVRYSTGDEAVAGVSADGTVAAGRRGLTAVLARAMGQVAATQIGVIPARSAGLAAGEGSLPEPDPEPNNVIDELVFAKQRRLSVAAFPLSSDREFARRVFLDVVGRLPEPGELREFLSGPGAGRRPRLIDRLLEKPEYAAFWTVKFEDWFRNNQLNSQGRSMGNFKDWIYDILARDRPYDQVVREMLTSQGDSFLNPAVNFLHPAADFMLKKFDMKKVTPTLSRLFLGIRMECAECHNHPLENFTQDDFYQLSAFFARIRVKHGYGEYRRTWYLEDEGEIEHPVTKKPVQPKFLGGAAPAIPKGADRRALLADWIVSPDNPYFARATVNRIWHQYFETGIVEPFDDFRSTNVPTNRELLDRLARHFVDGGFRLKSLHRLILNSRTYQLSSQNPAAPRDVEPFERLLFVRYEPRKLPAEVLMDSISQVTGVPHPFRGYPQGTRAVDLYIPDAPDYFLTTFGFPRRDILADRSKSPTLSQALHLVNGDTLLKKTEASENVLSRLISEGLEDAAIVSSLYERAYARPPSETETRSALAFLEAERQAGRSRRRALEGVLWSILNSKEFQLNH